MLFARNLFNKYKKKLLDTGLNARKTASKKVIHKANEARIKFTGNKITNKIAKPKHVIDENLRNFEEIIMPPEKREEIFKRIKNKYYKNGTL